MKIKNNTEYDFISQIVKDALTKSHLSLSGEPIENVEINSFDFQSILFTVEGCPFALRTYEVTPVAGDKLKVKYAMFIAGNENCMFMDEIKIKQPKKI